MCLSTAYKVTSKNNSKIHNAHIINKVFYESVGRTYPQKLPITHVTHASRLSQTYRRASLKPDSLL